MWLVGFGLAVLCYWRHAGALNAFGLVPDNLVTRHSSTLSFCQRGSGDLSPAANAGLGVLFNLNELFDVLAALLFSRRRYLTLSQ
jgi:hypothetical protein